MPNIGLINCEIGIKNLGNKEPVIGLIICEIGIKMWEFWENKKLFCVMKPLATY